MKSTHEVTLSFEISWDANAQSQAAFPHKVTCKPLNWLTPFCGTDELARLGIHRPATPTYTVDVTITGHGLLREPTGKVVAVITDIAAARRLADTLNGVPA